MGSSHTLALPTPKVSAPAHATTSTAAPEPELAPTAAVAVPAHVRGITGARLHMYDHCPYCVRVQLALAHCAVPYERVLYG